MCRVDDDPTLNYYAFVTWQYKHFVLRVTFLTTVLRALIDLDVAVTRLTIQQTFDCEHYERLSRHDGRAAVALPRCAEPSVRRERLDVGCAVRQQNAPRSARERCLLTTTPRLPLSLRRAARGHVLTIVLLLPLLTLRTIGGIRGATVVSPCDHRCNLHSMNGTERYTGDRVVNHC